MNLALIEYAAYFAGGALALGLFAHGRRQLRLRRYDRHPRPEQQRTGDPLADSFYCLMLKDGRTRGGFITDRKRPR